MNMLFVKGPRRNLVSVGWEDGILQAEFQEKRRYLYKGVPQGTFDKLLRSPYPDNLFSKIVRGKYECELVSAPSPKPEPWFDFDGLPF